MMAPIVILERHTLVTPVGLRFWDPVTETVIGDGLQVTVYPPNQPQRRVQAFTNPSGVFVLRHLPGLREAENGVGDEVFWKTWIQPAVRKTFVVEVVDTQGRFQPGRFEITAPARGLITAPCGPINSPVDPLAPGVPLYSTASRPAPTGMAVLYADLRDGLDAQGQTPAAWAVLEAHLPGGGVARGLAGVDGRVALFFPYPEPQRSSSGLPVGSPLSGSRPPLTAQQWSIGLAARYQRPSAPDRVPAIPELCDTLTQPAATLWADPALTIPLPTATLRFGRELVLNKLDHHPAQPVFVSTGP